MLDRRAVSVGRKYDFGRGRDHAFLVRKLALRIQKQMASMGLPAERESRSLLESAALLHDIGASVSNNRDNNHHEHSRNLLLREGLDEVAQLAYFHRSRPDPRDHNAPERIIRLSAILRLADALDYSLDQRVLDVLLSRDGDVIYFEVLATEKPILTSFRKKKTLFEEVFGVQIRVKLRAVNNSIFPAATWCTVYGSHRPGYPDINVEREVVEGWIRGATALGATGVVCLLSERELAYYDDLLGAYRRAFEAVLWAPVEDFRLCDPESLRKILKFLNERDDEDEITVVHCSAGYGRTGQILCCWLVFGRFLEPHEAVSVMRESGMEPMESVLYGAEPPQKFWALMQVAAEARNELQSSRHSP